MFMGLNHLKKTIHNLLKENINTVSNTIDSKIEYINNEYLKHEFEFETYDEYSDFEIKRHQEAGILIKSLLKDSNINLKELHELIGNYLVI